MALTISVVRDDAIDGEELTLTLDAPRIIVGRSKSCEVLLLDPSVSARHACIRREGGRNVIVDEGSTNGIIIDEARLPAHTPRVIRDGELVRVGRVWLQLSLAAGIPSGSGDKERIAMELLRRDLLAEGEAVAPELRVVEGPDEGTTLALQPNNDSYRLGRSREADLVLSDTHASRIHALVNRRKGRWWVSDNGSKRGSLLGDETLGAEAVPWPLDTPLRVGDTVIELRDPLPAAKAAALKAPDLPMRAQEHDETPPETDGDAPVETGLNEADDTADAAPTVTPTPTASAPLDAPRDPRGAGYISVDLVLILIALAIIGVSLAGLWWVLG